MIRNKRNEIKNKLPTSGWSRQMSTFAAQPTVVRDKMKILYILIIITVMSCNNNSVIENKLGTYKSDKIIKDTYKRYYNDINDSNNYKVIIGNNIVVNDIAINNISPLSEKSRVIKYFGEPRCILKEKNICDQLENIADEQVKKWNEILIYNGAIIHMVDNQVNRVYIDSPEYILCNSIKVGMDIKDIKKLLKIKQTNVANKAIITLIHENRIMHITIYIYKGKVKYVTMELVNIG